MKKGIKKIPVVLSLLVVCMSLIVGAITTPTNVTNADSNLPAPFTKWDITPAAHTVDDPVTSGGSSWKIDTEVSFDASQSGQYSISIPDYMTNAPDSVIFSAKSNVAVLNNYEHIGTAADYDGTTCTAWNGGYWKFNFSINGNQQVGGGSISLSGTLPSGYVNGFSEHGNVQLSDVNSNVLYEEAFYVNIVRLINSDTWGYGIKNNKIISTGAYADEYAQGSFEILKELNPDTYYDNDFAYGFLNKNTPEQNMEYVALTGPMMDKNGAENGTKNAKADITVADGLDVKNTNPNDINRTSQHGISVQSVEVTNQGGGHYIETPGTYKFITSNYKEVSGNYGDPLAEGEIRVSVAPDGRQHIEASLGDIAKDKKYYLQYRTDVVSLPSNSNPTQKYPNYLSSAVVSSNDFADVISRKVIWQTLAHGEPTAYGADLSVDKTKASRGEKINYKLHFKSNKDKLDADIKINTDDSKYILSNLKSSDPSVKLEYDAKNKIIHATSPDFGGKEFDITYTVDSKDMSVGYITKNSFTITSAIDGKTYLGNEVATEIVDKQIAGNITLHFVDADDNSMKLREDVVLTPEDTDYIGDLVSGDKLDHAVYDKNIDSSYSFSKVLNDVDLSNVAWTKDTQDITFLYEGGHLVFKSAPKQLEFGNHELFAQGEQTYNLESKDNDLVVQDGRTLSKKPTWTLSGQLTEDFQGVNTGSVLSDVLFYNDGSTDQAMSLNTPIDIVANHNTVDKNDVNISSDWSGAKGLKLKVRAGQAKSDEYNATIQWTLSDGVANK